MNRIRNIIENKKYIRCIKKNEKGEKNRIYCKHTLEHFVDTARIAYIISLEKGLNIDKEIIYASALLHDIGKWKQYESGIPHEIASSAIAKTILLECDFNSEEISLITEAIDNHRTKVENPFDLNGILALADKLSRNCFYCTVKGKCNWNDEKKNTSIYF
ncbi:MAG: HD domain-containing protein [Clostridiaceae bacterium]|nr:HD domain-containing protein [Clostridiaceae bacterium]